MIEQKKIKAGQYVFDCRVSGDPKGEPVILLHGFPESNIMWEKLMQDLTAEGYRCVAPNLRGYSEGARPKGKRNYHIELLAEDVANIADAVGMPHFHLIGHDWGAAVGWKVVFDFSDRITSWTGLSVPHLQSFYKAVAIDPDQRARSKYIRQFQIPFIPEMKMKAKNYAALRKLWTDQSPEEIDDYLRILKQKGALTATLNYYRGNYKQTKLAVTENILGDITTPTLFIWGEKDFAIGRNAVEGAAQFMKGPYRFVPINAGHWIVDDSYEQIKPEIIKHLKQFHK